MGVYDRGFEIPKPSFGFLGGGKDALPIMLGAIVVIIILAFAALNFADLFTPKAIALWLDKNPVNAEETVWLHARVTNHTGATLENVVVSAQAVDKSAIQISETSSRIRVLGAGENREVKFLVNPVSNSVFTGNYTIVVTATHGEGTLLETAEITLAVNK